MNRNANRSENQSTSHRVNQSMHETKSNKTKNWEVVRKQHCHLCTGLTSSYIFLAQQAHGHYCAPCHFLTAKESTHLARSRPAAGG